MNSTCELGDDATRALKPYPAYTDSGVEWLGDVPAHWEVLKLRHVLRRHTERERPDLPLLSVVREQGVILRDTTSTDENHNYIPDDLSNYKVVRAGQFAMNKMKAWQGSYGVSCHDGIVSPAYFVFDVLGLEVDFFHAALRSRAYVPAFTRASDGVRIGQWDLAEARMREIPFLVPPAAEQAAIVRFLDHADRRIRRYIRAQQKLIALLEEQKQALIHQAVTGQIDIRTSQPYPAYKPSGVEWLGDVPAHWQVRRLRYLIKGRLTYGANAAAEHTDPAWPRYLRITDFSKNGTLRKDTFRSLPPQTAKDYLVEPGDVLLARSGATVGKAFLVEEAAGVACHAGYLIRVRLNRSILHPAFFFAFTQSAAFTMWKDATFIISTIQNIGADRYADLSVPVPPISEQELLLRFLDESTADIDRAVERAEVEMALLREYRTSLIADVVTGKFDVRAAAARLHDEVEELEPLDEAETVIDGEEEPTDALATAP